MALTATYTDLGDGIIHIDAEYLSPGVASVYLLIEDDQCAIIETGTSHSVPYIISVLNEYGLNEASVRYVIPTHVHLDHAGGVGELMDICPNAELIIHPFGARHMIDPSKLVAGASAVYGEEAFKRLYGELKPVSEARIIEAPDLADIEFNGRALRFYDTPGHAKHHFCVHDFKSNTIFSGDTFGISYPSLETPRGPLVFATTTPVQFDPDALIASIDRLVSVKPVSFNLTHYGRVVLDEQVVSQLKISIEAYLSISEQHRDAGKTRCELIEASISEYLMQVYQTMGGTQPDAAIKKILAMDSKLNAQGLDFWMSKNNR